MDGVFPSAKDMGVLGSERFTNNYFEDVAYFSPCRKPKSGMILKAFEDFPDIDFKKSILIGDSDTDIIAAENVNIKSIQVSPTYTLSHWTKDFLTD